MSELPEVQLDLQIADATPKPRKLKGIETRPIPSTVERLAALADPEIDAKVREADKINASFDQAVKDLKTLWGPDPW